MTRKTSSALLAHLLVTMAMAMAFDAPEPCDWTYVDGIAGDVRLNCKARTITDELGRTGFNVEGVSLSSVAQLKVACSDVLFFQSTLANDSFVNVPNLKTLDIEFCKINALPPAAFRGLDKLKELSLQTHNTEWSAMSLNIAPAAFDTQKSLEALDLSRNNIWELPPGVFCSLPRLKTLNLTTNRLQDVSELGFNTKPCAPELTKLDVSSNEIESLPDDGFRGLGHMKHLFVQGNGISMVSDNAFAGLGNLQVLNISSNKLVALPPQVFRHTKYIQEIYAFNNSISVLAPGLFDGLSHLVVLDLSHNDLSSEWLKADTFKDLTRLIVLSLSHNRLTEFKNHMVSSLYGLQILRLDHNQISFIGPGAFSALYNLHTLVLSHNSIMQLDAHHMTGLHVLSLLDLDHNQLTTLHPDTFNNSSHLQDLNLSGNALNHVPKALQELKFLKTLDLGQNNISDLSGDPFKGLSQLYGLRLINNTIGDLTADMFKSLPMLKILNLAHNRVTSIAEGTLDQNQELQAVRLDGNFIRDINGVFTNLEKLIWLNVSDNYIEWFDYAIIPRSLEWLDIHKNQIRELGNYYGMENQLRLTTLEASFNKIAEISAKNLPNSLQLLFLNDNAIRNVAPYTFFDKVNLTRAYLYANQLSTLDLSALQLAPKDPGDLAPPPEFYIGGNPFQCDCKMEWLQRIGSLEHLPQVMDLDGVYCHLLFNRQRSFVPLVEVDSSQFLCNYHTHCFAICHCCDFDACDCEMTCPNNCTCYHDQSWAANIVDCTRAGYKSVPERIPMDATEVYLDGNSIEVLKSHLFIGRKNMRVLFMNSSSIVSINNGTFNGLKNLKTLHLENNRLMQLHGYEFEGLESLRELFLHDNELTIVNESVFAPLAALEILTLRNNRLVTFPVWTLTSINPYLFQVALAGNPWSCECGHVSVLGQWIEDNRAKIADASEIHCVHNATAVAVVGHNLTHCGGETQPVVVVQADSFEGHMTLVITGVVLGLVLVAFVMMAVIIRYRKELRVWAFANCGLRICQSSAYEGDSERLFDAFVTYSSKDEAFVTQKLAPELEQGSPNYRLCLHYRDFPVSSYLADTIIGGVESSKRTLLVLSQNFLQSEWCRFEFKSALHQVLRDRQKRLVVIVYGDVPQRDLDPDLRLYLKASTCVYWGEKLFWEKLRFAMPDVKPQPASHQTTANTSINGAALANAAAIAAHHHHHLHHMHHHHGNGNGGVIDTVSTSTGTLVSNGRHSNNCPTYAEHTYATPKFDTASSTYGTTHTMNANHFHHHLQHHMAQQNGHHHHHPHMGPIAAPQAPLNNGILWRPPDMHQVS